jgi:drug/metabolite transporter (DMT)-like permease
VKKDLAGSSVASVVCGAVMISFSGVWVTLADVGPTVSAFYRVFFGSLFLLAAALYHKELKWPDGRALLLGIACGFFFALDLFCWHRSIQFVGLGLATIMANFEVFILAFIGVIFLGDSIRWWFLASLPLAFVGLFLIVGIDWNLLERLYKTGIYFGLATAVCYALFIVSLKKLQADQNRLSVFYVLTLVSITATAFLGTQIVCAGKSFAIPNLKSFLALAALALFSQFIGWILITNALPRIRTSLAGLLLLLQPSLAFVWDVLLFQKSTTPINWIGVAIAVGAIYMGMTGVSASKN